MRHSRKSVRRRQTVLIEACEKRVVFDATYHSLAGGAFIQSWTNTSQISVTDNWLGVPSIIGYRGDNLTAANDVNPQTVVAPGVSLADTPAGVEDVNANQTNPNTYTTGGVAEFEITDPVVAFQGSGTADAPFLLIHLDTTGKTSVPVKYDLRDIDGSADNCVQQVAAQYRVGDTGNFIDIPAGYVADASTGPSLATLVTNVSFTLPAACDNQSKVQLRIITTNASNPVGTGDEFIGVDNIEIGSGSVPTTIQFAAPTAVFNENSGTVNVSVTRGGDASSAVDVIVNSTGGTATVGSDYTAVTNQTVHFNAGETTANATLSITNDSALENAETIVLTLSNPTVGSIGVPASTTVTIADDDSSATSGVVLNEMKVTAPGNDNPYEYVEIKGPANTTLYNTYLIAWEGKTVANAGLADYLLDLSGATIGSNGLLLIRGAGGHASSEAGTTIITDARLDTGDTFEGGTSDPGDSLTFGLYFSPAPLVQATDYDTDNSGTLDWGTVLPSLPIPTTMDSVGWTDGTAADWVYSTATITMAAPATGDSPDAITRFRTNTSVNDTAAWYGGLLAGTTNNTLSYDNNSGNLTSNFPAGGILTPGGANAPSGAGLLNFSQNPYSVNEGTSTITITVNRLGGSTGTATVQYSTADGTAFAGSDYTATAGTLTFLNGETSKTFDVTILNDSIYEGTESFTVNLSNVTGADLGAPSSVVNLEDNDPVSTPNVLLNELNVDPPTPGNDQPYEYAEIISQVAGQALGNVYLVGIEGDSNANTGRVSFVQNLTGFTTGTNKLAIIKAPSPNGHTPIEGATTVIANSTFTNSSALQNGGHSFLLIFSPDSAITLNQQLGDIGGDLSLLPGGAVVLDAVGWKGSPTTGTTPVADVVFGGVDLSFASPADGTGIPTAATRILGDTTALNGSSWYYGALTASGGNSVLTYGTPASANMPAGMALTPGGANVVDGIAPTVSSIVFEKNLSGQAPSITVTFSEAVSGITLSDAGTSSFTITDRSTNTAILAANFTLTPVSTSVYKITFTGANGAPADGDFKITVNAANVKDLANNPMAANTSQNYSFLQGDINDPALPGGNVTGDRKVNSLDFNILAANFGASGKSFVQGDLSFNGTVDSVDFGILVGQYGKSLVAVPPPAPMASSLFGSSRITGDLLETVLA